MAYPLIHQCSLLFVGSKSIVPCKKSSRNQAKAIMRKSTTVWLRFQSKLRHCNQCISNKMKSNQTNSKRRLSATFARSKTKELNTQGGWRSLAHKNQLRLAWLLKRWVKRKFMRVYTKEGPLDQYLVTSLQKLSPLKRRNRFFQMKSSLSRPYSNHQQQKFPVHRVKWVQSLLQLIKRL